MKDFEEKYKTLMKFMLPLANKCIKSVEVVGFEEGALTQRGNRPKSNEDKKMFASPDDSITPVVNVTVDNICFPGGAMLTMALRGDVFTKMLDLHDLYFPDRKLNANIRFINIL